MKWVCGDYHQCQTVGARQYVSMSRSRDVPTPIPNAEPSKASIAASPPEDPPHVWSGEYGLTVLPNTGLEHSNANIVCGTLVLQKTIAPAARNTSTTAESSSLGLLEYLQSDKSLAVTI